MTATQETVNLTLAEGIYSALFGHLDDKHHRAGKVGEIADWLAEGDSKGVTLHQLTAEWADVDGADPDIKRPTNTRGLLS